MKKASKMSAVFLAALMALTACGEQQGESTEQSTEAVSEAVQSTEAASSEEAKAEEMTLYRGYTTSNDYGANFIRIGVVTSGDKIVDSTIDSYIYGETKEDYTFVPMAVPEGATNHLFSKRTNDEAYSKLMKDKAKATHTVAEGYDAISEFAKGKTIQELKDVLAKAEPGKPLDAISSATLVNTYDYVQGIIDTVEKPVSKVTFTADPGAKVQLTAAAYGAHGEKSFADVLVAVADGKILGADIDEFQYMAAESKGVPNSEKDDFKAVMPEGKVLASKKENSESYSAAMKEKAQSTVSIADNYAAIEKFVAGKTTDEVQKVVDENPKGKPVDAVTGATLVDTSGYLAAILEAAKTAK